MYVGNNWAGTASIVDADTLTVLKAGIDLIPDKQQELADITADPAKLAAMNLTLEDVRLVLVNATVNTPKGTLEGPNRAYAIYANDQLTRAAELNNVIIGWRNGAPIRPGQWRPEHRSASIRSRVAGG